ncbi:Dibasic-processing endoprotease [Gossypium arboreum]|uniref:Dibasic-processing endoprotease n=1 Tax=Gossypium arboreum TaxID=29729 RepID=A0A0B0N3G4_GOSAR|nr:Dibasic-processing endoprotease [Gossypium arboreum]KHG29752.1 Dibasic-processing endoprotease [Gossypium arboreum]
MDGIMMMMVKQWHCGGGEAEKKLMACLDMYNSEHKGNHHHCPPMSPRISFSNDFVETQQVMKQERNSREAPVSSDFEFSVSNYSMMSADELFFKVSMERMGDNKRFAFVHEDTHVAKTSQELLTEGGSGYRNVEIGI